MVSFQTGNKFKGKVNAGLFYTVEYPLDFFEKSVRPNLKQSEDLLGMLNGNVVIDSFSTITKTERSAKSSDELSIKEEQLSRDLNEIFDIAAELSK